MALHQGLRNNTENKDQPKLEDKKTQATPPENQTIPPDLLCPITKLLFVKPVQLSCAHAVEEEALKRHFDSHGGGPGKEKEFKLVKCPCCKQLNGWYQVKPSIATIKAVEIYQQTQKEKQALQAQLNALRQENQDLQKMLSAKNNISKEAKDNIQKQIDIESKISETKKKLRRQLFFAAAQQKKLDPFKNRVTALLQVRQKAKEDYQKQTKQHEKSMQSFFSSLNPQEAKRQFTDKAIPQSMHTVVSLQEEVIKSFVVTSRKFSTLLFKTLRVDIFADVYQFHVYKIRVQKLTDRMLTLYQQRIQFFRETEKKQMQNLERVSPSRAAELQVQEFPQHQIDQFLADAIENDRSNTVSLMLSRFRADPNIRSLMESKSALEFPIITAVRRHRVESVKLLLQHKVNLKVRNQKQIVLESKNPDLFYKEAPKLVTPISLSVILHGIFRHANQFAITKLLLDAGADLHYRDAHERTLLHLAAMNLDDDMIQELCQRGLSVHVVDRDGLTPLELMKTTHEGDFPFIEQLLTAQEPDSPGIIRRQSM
jgi:hypothetical protein